MANAANAPKSATRDVSGITTGTTSSLNRLRRLKIPPPLRAGPGVPSFFRVEAGDATKRQAAPLQVCLSLPASLYNGARRTFFLLGREASTASVLRACIVKRMSSLILRTSQEVAPSNLRIARGGRPAHDQYVVFFREAYTLFGIYQFIPYRKFFPKLPQVGRN